MDFASAPSLLFPECPRARREELMLMLTCVFNGNDIAFATGYLFCSTLRFQIDDQTITQLAAEPVIFNESIFLDSMVKGYKNTIAR